MTVQTYLDGRASNAVLSIAEKASIDISIATLVRRINSYFPNELSSHFKFGSSTRGTILPRDMDSRSDIDYMIVFEDESYRPQTYVSKLKRFAEHYYGTSEIVQSHPTVVLKLNHIKFDLVPAISESWLGFGEYRIPAPSSSYEDWMSTSPNDFNTTLSSANVNTGYKLKPAIRLLKFWNARAGYVFESYGLEKWAANQSFWWCSTTRDHLFSLFEGLSLDWGAPKWRKDKLDRAKQVVEDTKDFESRAMPATAELEIKKIIPAE